MAAALSDHHDEVLVCDLQNGNAKKIMLGRLLNVSYFLAFSNDR
jgi:hypothetical protein